MNISTTIRPQITQRPAAPKQSEEPKEPWTKQAGDYLEQSTDILTPKLGAFALGAKFAMKGNQITESLHPVAKAIGIIGGGAVGAFLGYSGGQLVSNASSFVGNSVFGEDSSLGKSVVQTGLNTAAFGLVGGWTGAALYGAFSVGGAAELARRDA